MSAEVDPEVAAIQKLTESLAPLDEAARQRVIDWAMRRYGSASTTVAAATRATEQVTAQRPVPVAAAANSDTVYEHFADLYDAAKPKTDAEKALVGGYWLQVCQKQEYFASRDVNELLKHHGHPVSNITRAFDLLRESKPTYAAQLEKSGKSKQARKKMKLTTAGVRKVEAMINGNDEE